MVPCTVLILKITFERIDKRWAVICYLCYPTLQPKGVVLLVIDLIATMSSTICFSCCLNRGYVLQPVTPRTEVAEVTVPEPAKAAFNPCLVNV